MLYEYRLYEAAPGKLGALHKRFATVTIPIWERLGIRPIGFWTAEVGTSNQLHYILQWQDAADRQTRWATFMADKEWQEKRAASEVDGPLVVRLTNSLWSPTNYSPMQ